MIADLFSWPSTPSGAFVALVVIVVFYTEIRFWIRSRTSQQPPCEPLPVRSVKVDPAKFKDAEKIPELQQQLSALQNAAKRNETEIAEVKAELIHFAKNIGYKKELFEP